MGQFTNIDNFISLRKGAILANDAVTRLLPVPGRSFTVYAALNSINGHAYVGITSRPVRKRAQAHINNSISGRLNTHFARAIRKYGSTSFQFYSVLTCRTKEEAYRHEQSIIEDLRPEYNLTKGGDGVIGLVMSDEAKSKMRAAKLRRAGRREIAMKAAALVSKPVICVTDGKTYPSCSAAARYYGLTHSDIVTYCKGKFKSRRGLVFRYIQQ